MKLRAAQAILTEIRDGEALNELSLAFHEAIGNVREHGKPCTITLTMTVGTLGEGKHQLVEPPVVIKAKVETKLHRPEPQATIFFVDADGNPTRNLTRQEGLNLSVAVGAASGDTKA